MSEYDLKLFIPNVEQTPQSSKTPAAKSQVKKPAVLFSYDIMLMEIKNELKQKESEKLYKLFEKADTEDLYGNQTFRTSADLILNENEQNNLFTKLKKKYPRLYKVVNEFIQNLQAETNAEKIANIFNLKGYDSSLDNNDQIFAYGLSYLNNSNLLDVSKEYDGLSLLYDIFEDLDKRADDKELKEFKEKCKGFANHLINTAKKINIYTKDYENVIEKAVNNNDTKNLAVYTQRLADRIIITTDKEKSFSASKNALKLKDANGKIDADFVQGYTGDCWFLCSLKSMCGDEEFLKRINNLITVNKENDVIKSITVDIQGKDYTIDYENIKQANEYATGDLDVRALEMAINQYMHENNSGHGDISLGWEEKDAYKFLLGEDNVEVTEYFSNDKFYDTDFQKFDSERYLNVLKEKSGNNVISSLGIYGYNSAYDKDDKLFAENTNGEQVEINYGHSYNYTKIDKKYLYFTDPNAPKQELRVPLEKVGEIFDCACTVKLK